MTSKYDGVIKRTYIIRPEETKDYREVENLTREAFWNVYHPGCTEHFVLHKFRQDKDFIPELSLVLEVAGQIIGHIMYARSEMKADDGRRIPMMTFGPVSIHPEFQRQGWGKILVDDSLARAKSMGAGAVAITGNIDFYGKSGFVVASTRGLRHVDAPPEDAVVPYFLFRELEPGYLEGITGTYKDPTGYFVCEKYPEEFDAFEAQFPPKEKLKLPGQLE